MEQLQSFLTYFIIFALAIGVYASLLSLRLFGISLIKYYTNNSEKEEEEEVY